jgi:hypothetical protein
MKKNDQVFADSREKAKAAIVAITTKKIDNEIASMFKVRTTAWG